MAKMMRGDLKQIIRLGLNLNQIMILVDIFTSLIYGLVKRFLEAVQGSVRGLKEQSKETWLGLTTCRVGVYYLAQTLYDKKVDFKYL
jgi:hypothetical protein